MSDTADTTEVITNTDAQIAAHEAQEAAWAEERTWPLYRVVLTGNDVEWAPRADERYWQVDDPNNPRPNWIPKAAEDLPEDASLHPESGQVVRQAKCEVTMHARSEDYAKMLALRDNPDYFTVVSVELMGE